METSREYIDLIMTTRGEIMYNNIISYWSLGREETDLYVQIMSCHGNLMDMNGFWRARINELFTNSWAFMKLCGDKTVKEMPKEAHQIAW